MVKKVLQSAIANAENNHDLDVDDLVVAEASVGKNLVMKRFHARARGNAGGIEKFFSQITIVVEEKREEEGRRSRRRQGRQAGRQDRRQETRGKSAREEACGQEGQKETA